MVSWWELRFCMILEKSVLCKTVQIEKQIVLIFQLISSRASISVTQLTQQRAKTCRENISWPFSEPFANGSKSENHDTKSEECFLSSLPNSEGYIFVFKVQKKPLTSKGELETQESCIHQLWLGNLDKIDAFMDRFGEPLDNMTVRRVGYRMTWMKTEFEMTFILFTVWTMLIRIHIYIEAFQI